MAFIKDRLTLSFDTSKFGSGLYLSPEAQNMLNNSPTGLSEWQRKDIANSTVVLSNYYKNPVLDQCNRLLANTTNIRNLCLGDVANNYPSATAEILTLANTANNLLVQLNEFKYHTDNISGLTVSISDSEAADLPNIPNFQSAVSVGAEATRILYTTESYKTTTPILGSFTSIFVGSELYANSNSVYNSYSTLSTSGSSVTSTEVNSIISNLQSVNTFIYTRRTSDWNFFKQVKSVVEDFYEVSKLTKFGNTENYLVNNYIGTDTLKVNLNNAASFVPTEEEIENYFANTQTTVTPATISTQLTSAISAATEAFDSAGAAFSTANQALSAATTAIDSSQLARDTANIALSNSLDGLDAQARSTSIAAFDRANAALSIANASEGTAVDAENKADVASSRANSALSQVTSAYTHANAAFAAANNATDTWVRQAANSASSYANGAFSKANTANTLAQSAFDAANNAVDTWVRQAVNSASSYANSAYQSSNTVLDTVNIIFSTVNASFNVANSATTSSIDLYAREHSNAAFNVANSVTDTYARNHSNAAFNTANGKLSLTGGEISGDLNVTGNLTIAGNVITVDTQSLSLEDNMIYLNANNNVANPDLGFAGNYNDGTYKHSGLFRDATDGMWKFFDGYLPEPDASPYIDTSHASFQIGTVNALIQSASVDVRGYDILDYANAIYNFANTINSTSSFSISYSGLIANAALIHANSAYDFANTLSSSIGTDAWVRDAANSASSYSNSAFIHANAAFSAANSKGTGTVTSVAINGGGTGLTFTGTPITTSGTFLLGGTLSVSYGGTGATSFTSGSIIKGSGSGALSEATGSDIVNAIGSNYVQNASYASSAGSVTGGVTESTFTGSRSAPSSSWSNGYQTLPGGITIQFGRGVVPSGGGGLLQVYFPVAFSYIYSAVATRVGTATGGFGTGAGIYGIGTTSYMFVSNPNLDYFHWIAIGRV